MADRVIMSAYQTKEWLAFFQGKDVFTPTENNIIQAENIFTTKFPNMNGYYRQYFGVINEKNQEEIHMLAFRKGLEKSFPDWRKKAVIVKDGGETYYDGAVNIDTQTLIHVGPHGEG